MKILIFGDVHWSINSSIVRKRGEFYSLRLENLIKSLNWVNQLSIEHKCDKIVGLGDLFDSCDLKAEEISALKEVKWNTNIQTHLLVGNHESNISSLMFSSADVFNGNNFIVENKVRKYDLSDSLDMYFLPYTIEDNRKELKEYLKDSSKKHIIFSHNDIKGIRYGMFESREGFDLKEIEDNSQLFINGHLHNGSFLNANKTILNLGNLSGQNFTEDAFKYHHLVCILDTETLKLQFFENPYAFNFYKLEISKESDLSQLETLKQNAVLYIKCIDSCVDNLKTKLATMPNIIESKVIIVRTIIDKEIEQDKVELANKDYLEQYSTFMKEKLGNNDVVLYELSEVCK